MRRTRVRPALEVLEERRVPAALIVDTTADNNVRDGDLSLREAVAVVNGTLALGGLTAQEQAQVRLDRPRQLPGRPHGLTAQPLGTNDTIVFAASLAGRTIALTLDDPNRAFGPTALALTSSMTIDGTAAPGLTIDGTGTHRTFAVGAGASVILTNLTLTGGRAQGGNGGSSLATNNAGGGGAGAAGMGGAIYSIGTLSIRGVTFTANTAQGGAGGQGLTGEFVGAGGGGGGVGGNGGDFTGDGAPHGGGGGGVGGSGGADGTGGANENGVQAEPVAAGTLGGGGGGNGGFGTDRSSGGFGGGGGGGNLLGGSGSGGGDGGFGSGGGGGGFGSGGDGGFGGGGGGGDSDTFGGGGFGGGDGDHGDNQNAGGGGAGMGGAIFNNGGTLTIVNSTFTANVAAGGIAGGLGAKNGSGLGGAIFSRNGSVTLTNVTISANTAAQGGRGVYIVGQDATATAVLINTILGQTDNSVSDFDSEAINDGSVSTAGSTNNLVRNNGDGLAASAIVSSADPRLAALAHNGGPTPTMALLAGSPARNAGSVPAAIGLPTDQRGPGFPRIVDGSVDLGAFETQPGLVSGFGRGRDAFVATLYRDNLGRLPDLATLKSLSRRLAAGAPPRQVVRSIWGGAEHQRLVKEGLVAPLTFRQAYVNALRAGRQAAGLRRPR